MGQDIDGEAAIDWSGYAVSLNTSGTIVAIGAIYNDGTYVNRYQTGTDAGHVRVYQYNGSQWIQLGADIEGVAQYTNAGDSVSLSGSGQLVAIGAPAYIPPGSPFGQYSYGHVRIFYYNGSQWNEVSSNIVGEGSWHYFGYAVSLSRDGTTLAAGSERAGRLGFNDSGIIKVYKLSN